jgi:mannosyltransferase
VRLTLLTSGSRHRDRQAWGRWLTSCAILLIAAYVRLNGLVAHGLWYDEILTALRGRESLDWLIVSSPFHSWPLLYLIAKLSTYLFGPSDFAIRFPSVIEGVLGVAFILRLGRRFYGWWAGLGAALLLALSPLHIYASRDARYYPLIVLLCLVTTNLLWQALTKKQRKHWIGFLLVTIAALYNHPSALLVLTGQLISIAGWVLSGFVSRGMTRSQNGLAAPLRAALLPGGFALVAALIGGAYLLFLPRAVTSTLLSESSQTTVAVELSWSFFAGLVSALGAGPGWISLVFVSAFLLGIAASGPNRAATSLLIVMLATPLAILPLMRQAIPFVYKYVIFMLPLYLLLVAQGLVAIFGLGRQLSFVEHRHATWMAALPALFVLAVLLLFEIQESAALVEQQGEEWREMASFLRQQAASDDIIAVAPMKWPLNAPSSMHVLEYYHPASGGADLQVVHSPFEMQELCANHDQLWLALAPPYTPIVTPPTDGGNATPSSSIGFYPDFRLLAWDCRALDPRGQSTP